MNTDPFSVKTIPLKSQTLFTKSGLNWYIYIFVPLSFYIHYLFVCHFTFVCNVVNLIKCIVWEINKQCQAELPLAHFSSWILDILSKSNLLFDLLDLSLLRQFRKPTKSDPSANQAKKNSGASGRTKRHQTNQGSRRTIDIVDSRINNGTTALSAESCKTHLHTRPMSIQISLWCHSSPSPTRQPNWLHEKRTN